MLQNKENKTKAVKSNRASAKTQSKSGNLNKVIEVEQIEVAPAMGMMTMRC